MIKRNISLGILLFINLIFSYKYLNRYFDYAAIISFAILIIQILLLLYSNRLSKISAVKYLPVLGVFTIVSLAFVVHFKVDIHTLNVDRWSVLDSFIRALFEGDYPYLAKSHMGNYPGPMPMYYIFALPAYFIGELNVLSVLGYVYFFWLSYKGFEDKKNLIVPMVLITSLFMYWEILTRSNIVSYSVIALIILVFYQRNQKNSIHRNLVISAVLTGFTLATRSVFILPYIIIFFASFLNKEIKLKELIMYGIIAVISFGVVFLPFIIFYDGQFWEMNPFIIQSSFLIPQGYILIFIGISIVMSLFAKSQKDAVFFSGVSLFVSITIYAVYHLINLGFKEAYVNSKIDISYFLFCVPFFLYYVLKFDNSKDYKVI